MAALINLVEPDSVSAEGLEAEDREIPVQGNLHLNEQGLLAGYDRERVVAEDAAGHVIGYAAIWRAPWAEPGILSSLLCVQPEYRRQGIGSALAAHLEQWARQHGASRWQSVMRDGVPEFLAFAERRGFAAEMHTVEWVLDLSRFDATRFADTVDRTRSSGIRLFTLADVLAEDSVRKLYDLFVETHADIPGVAGGSPSFKEWRDQLFDGEHGALEWVFIAADGDRFVGVCTLFRTKIPGLMYTDYTGVRREYRGRGIAVALKLLSVGAAIAAGARTICNETEARNFPMQAVYRKLGYVPGVALGTGGYVIRKYL